MAVRGTGRGRRLGLTREKVIAAAVTMIDRDGPESFSLRKLAAALDVEVMSLYNHVPNKEALLDGVAETLLAGIDFSGAAEGTWQDRVRAHAAAFRAAARRNPRAFRLVCTRPTRSPAALETIASALRGLSGLDLPPQELVHVLRTYISPSPTTTRSSATASNCSSRAWPRAAGRPTAAGPRLPENSGHSDFRSGQSPAPMLSCS